MPFQTAKFGFWNGRTDGRTGGRAYGHLLLESLIAAVFDLPSFLHPMSYMYVWIVFLCVRSYPVP